MQRESCRNSISSTTRVDLGRSSPGLSHRIGWVGIRRFRNLFSSCGEARMLSLFIAILIGLTLTPPDPF